MPYYKPNQQQVAVYAAACCSVYIPLHVRGLEQLYFA